MPASVAEFAKAAEGSGILAAESLAEYVQGVAADTDATALANRLVKDGLLTAFQARSIYGGKVKSLVLGPYVVLDILGKGGMGYVYKAEHRKMRRVVAVKVISKAALKSPAAIQRFEREVQAAARLEHPNIVTAFDAGEAAGTHYLVMQFVEGRNLSEVVKELGPQPVGRAVDWILQAARGLAFAHEQGVIHRDIKPGNLLVDPHGTVKILDMGLARLETLDADQDQLTGTGQIMGTVDYMAPEQAMDTRQADARSDIYSLGVTLWNLLTGRPLFGGDTAMNKMMAHMQNAVPPLTGEREDVGPEVDAVFQRMVAKKPADRFQSMREVIEALQALPQGMAAPGPPCVVLGAGTTSTDSSGTAATQTLQHPQAVAADEDTARLSPFRIDTAPGVQRLPSDSPRPAGWLQPQHLAIGGGVVGVVLLIGIMLFTTGGRRGAKPGGRRVGTAAKPVSPLDSLPTVADMKPTTPRPFLPNEPDVVGELATPEAEVTPPPMPEKKKEAPPTAPKPPPTPPRPAAANAGLRPAGPVDVLALIDPTRDRQDGSPWSRDGGALVSPAGASGCLRLPIEPQEAFILALDVQRVDKQDGVVYILVPVADHEAVVEFRHEQHVSISNLDETNPENYSAFYCQNPLAGPAMHRIELQVGGELVRVHVDGKPLVSFEGDASRLLPSNGVPQRTSAERRILLRADHPSTRVTRIEYRPMTEAISAQLQLAEDRLVPRNLLAGVDVARDSVTGEWRRDRERFDETHKPGQMPGLISAGDAPRQFTLTTLVERRDLVESHNRLGLGMPVRGARLTASIDYNDEISGLWFSNGRNGPDPLHPASFVDPCLILPGRSNLVTWTVTSKGVEGTVNGRRIMSWNGDVKHHDWRDNPYVGRSPDKFFVTGAGFCVSKLDLRPLGWRSRAKPETSVIRAAVDRIQRENPQAYEKNAKPATRLLTAEALLKAAALDADDAGMHFAQLEEAVQLAANAGDLPTAIVASEDLAAVYDVDPRDYEKQVVATVFKVPRSGTARQQLLEDSLRMMDRAVMLERFELAASLLAAVEGAAGKVSAELRRELRTRGIEYRQWRSEWETAQQSRRALAADARDKQAHETLGRYLGLVNNQWHLAREHFLQGDETPWRAIAEGELKYPTESVQQVALGNLWWSLSEKASASLKPWYQEKADVWYRRASPKLSGAAKVAVEKRREQLGNSRKTSGGAFAMRHPVDAVKIGDHWYKFFQSRLPWKTICTICDRLGGSLVVIDSAAENEAVALYALNETKKATGRESLRLAIGGSDHETEGVFRWVDGRPVSGGFTAWSNGEPDNAGSVQDYLLASIGFQKNAMTVHWEDANDRECDSFVCEWEY